MPSSTVTCSRKLVIFDMRWKIILHESVLDGFIFTKWMQNGSAHRKHLVLSKLRSIGLQGRGSRRNVGTENAIGRQRLSHQMPAFAPLIPVGCPGGGESRGSAPGLVVECFRKQVWDFVLVITTPPDSMPSCNLAYGLPITHSMTSCQWLLLFGPVFFICAL